jgi:phage FluMu protein Com
MNAIPGTIVLACKECGKEIIRPEGKVTGLVKCSQCHTVNRTPGIAMQARVTELQLARMQKTLRTYRVALWLPFCAIIPLAIVGVLFALVLPGLEIAAYLVEGGLVVFLFLCMMEARGFLGYSKGMALALFCFLAPVWWLVTFSTYFHLKRRVSFLVMNGTRPS